VTADGKQTMSAEDKCECQHCGEHIAFSSEAAGQTVECPHCGKETQLFVSPQAKPVPKETQELSKRSKALHEEYIANHKRFMALTEEGIKKDKEAAKKANDAGVAFKKFHWPGDNRARNEGNRLLAEAEQLMAEAEQLRAKAAPLREDYNRLKKLWEESLKFAPRADGSEPSANYATCPCQHCGGAMEFDASELVEENSLVQCPHCGLETKLFIPPAADNSTSEASEETDAPAQETDSLAKAEADKATRDAQWKELEERVNNRLIYSNLDTLELRGDTVTITKRGWANALASGMNGARTIQISSITVVQMKLAGMMMGYILFSYAGSKPFMGGMWEATQDPDTFLFGRDLNGEVAEFKAMVEKKMRESKQPAPAPANNSSGTLTDELRKLSEFKQQGILSQEEFEAAKKKLLA
jgi:DNA-directed RNA polymerase subunit RPC12/RpoP